MPNQVMLLGLLAGLLFAVSVTAVVNHGPLETMNGCLWLIWVLLTTVVVPLTQLLIQLYIYLPLKLNRVPWLMAPMFRFAGSLQPWSMMEVFLIGIIVALVKLLGMAQIVPGIALWSFALLIVTLAAAAANMDSRVVWDRVEYSR